MLDEVVGITYIFLSGIQMEPIVQNHKQRNLEMKTIYFLLCIGLLFTSCSSVPTSNIYSTNSIQTTYYVEKAISSVPYCKWEL